MTMGTSGGRAQRNPARPRARQRLTEDERAQVTRLRDDPDEWPDDTNDSYRRRLWTWLTLRWGCLLLAMLFATPGGPWWLLGTVAWVTGYELLGRVEPEVPRITRSGPPRASSRRGWSSH